MNRSFFLFRVPNFAPVTQETLNGLY